MRPFEDLGVKRMGAEPLEKFSEPRHLLWRRMHLSILGLLWVARKFDSSSQLFPRHRVEESVLVRHPGISLKLQVDFLSCSLLSRDSYAIGN